MLIFEVIVEVIRSYSPLDFVHCLVEVIRRRIMNNLNTNGKYLTLRKSVQNWRFIRTTKLVYLK